MCIFYPEIFYKEKKNQPWYNWNIVESGIKHHNSPLKKVQQPGIFLFLDILIIIYVVYCHKILDLWQLALPEANIYFYFKYYSFIIYIQTYILN
jgi:hypothetical protein